MARAEEARDESIAAGREAALIAGCVPPLHESYRHDRVGSEEEMLAAYTQIVKAVAPKVLITMLNRKKV